MRIKALAYRVLIVVMILLCPVSAAARNLERKVFFGVEWGYAATIAQFSNLSYQNSDGIRIYDDSNDFTYKSNAALLGKIGVRLSNRTVLSINSGYCGIYQDRAVVPLTLRGSFYTKGLDSEGLMFFADGGAGFTKKSFQKKLTLMGKLGFGYHFNLNQDYSIDLIMAVQAAFDHPNEVVDRFAAEFVREPDIFMSNVTDLSLQVGISINF